MHQFFVFGVAALAVVWDYWDSIVQLVSKAVHCVVHDYHLGQLTVLYDPQVLNVYSFWTLNAMVSIEPEVEKSLLTFELSEHQSSLLFVFCGRNHFLLFKGQVVRLFELFFKGVQDHVRVGLVRGCEDYYLVVLNGFFEAFVGVGTNVDASGDGLAGGEGDGDWEVEMAVFDVVDAVHEGFVEVKNNGLSMRTLWQLNSSMTQFRLTWLADIFHILQRLKSLN